MGWGVHHETTGGIQPRRDSSAGWLVALVMCAMLPFMGVGAAVMGKAAPSSAAEFLCWCFWGLKILDSGWIMDEL
jgi:hypothetical protein